MSHLDHSWLARRIRARAGRHWAAMLDRVRASGATPDARTLEDARALRHILADLLVQSEATAGVGQAALARMALPAGTDWRWRPQILQARNPVAALVGPASGKWLSPEVALFHDCAHQTLILRQCRNRRATDLADFGLSLEVMGFSGSYLSCSLALPAPALDGLGKHHILRLELVLDAERPIAVYARLNVQQGPNTETILRKTGDDVAGPNNRRLVEFDLGYAQLTPRSVDKAWLDLIFEAPAMNALVLRDVVMSRHTRAQM